MRCELAAPVRPNLGDALYRWMAEILRLQEWMVTNTGSSGKCCSGDQQEVSRYSSDSAFPAEVCLLLEDVYAWSVLACARQ